MRGHSRRLRKALPGAAAVELVHNFSLIHDDIEDGDEKRRHRATVWKLWGVPQAINTGDAMDVVSYMAIMDLKIDPAAMVEILQVFNDTIMQLCEGQYLDMDFQKRDDVTVEEYIEMITGKTAALIEASTAIGAMAAGGDRDTIGGFKSFGQRSASPSRYRTTCWASGATRRRPASPRATTSETRRRRCPSCTPCSTRKIRTS